MKKITLNKAQNLLALKDLNERSAQYIGMTLLLAAWFFWPVIVRNWYGVIDSGDQGVFGDTYGALNALYSGIALLLVATTLFMIRKDLQENTRVQAEFAKVLETKLDQDRILNKRRLTVDLYEQWNEEGFRNARHKVEQKLIKLDHKGFVDVFKDYPEFPDGDGDIGRVFMYFKMARKLAVEAAIEGPLLLDLIDRDSLKNWIGFFNSVESSRPEYVGLNDAFFRDMLVIKEFIG